MESNWTKESFNLIFDLAPYPMWVFDLETLAFLTVNDAAITHYGYTREEMLAMTILDINAPDEIPTLLEMLDALKRGDSGSEETRVWRHRKKDGRIIDVNVTAYPLLFKGRESLLVFIHDVTERRQAREEREALLEAVFQQMPAAVFLAEAPSGKIVLFNDKVELTLGHPYVPASSIEEYAYYRAVHPDGHRPYAAEEYPITRSLSTGEVVTDEEMLYRQDDGSYCTLSVSSAPVRNAEGTIIAGVVTIFDLTERKRAQVERERFLHELAEAQAKELALREEATQRMDAFLGIVSHELKTPLTAVMGTLEIAMPIIQQVVHQQEEQIEGRGRRRNPLVMLERAQQQVHLLARLVNDLVDVSRIQTKALEMHMTLCDLTTIVAEKVEEQRLMSPTRSLYFICETVGENVLVYADAERLGQVVTNYLSNALKYSKIGQPVEVGVRKEGQMARVWVRDRGTGISQQALDHIWERFYREPGVKVQTGSGVGLGLGLHISRSIIERHQGRVGVESTLGEGSTFWFILPLARTEDNSYDARSL